MDFSKSRAGAWVSMPIALLPIIRATLLGLLSFAVLVTAILAKPARTLSDFDQSFYLTIAYDLDHYGVFSNGVFDNIDSTRAVPPPGMFFVPGYPLVVLATMKLNARFAKAVECTVMAVNQDKEAPGCEPYETPVRIIHAALLALGIVAIAFAGASYLEAQVCSGSPGRWRRQPLRLKPTSSRSS
jgi:hypothetical protein